MLIAKGYVAVGGYDPKRRTYGITYLGDQDQEAIDNGVLKAVSFDKKKNLVDVRYTSAPTKRMKTVWHRTSHDAGAHGSEVLTRFYGEKRFSFPKSLYAVKDTLAAVCGDNPNAIIMDFFGGSGTTLHATCLLNAEDGGNRRAIIVTNNEVGPQESNKLHKAGLYRGDDNFEAWGIFEYVTRPRVEATLTGIDPTGKPVKGRYMNGTPFADGFRENATFLRLDFLDPEEVEVGMQTSALLPVLWLKTGAHSSCPLPLKLDVPYSLNLPGGFAVLYEEYALAALQTSLRVNPSIETVFVMSDDAAVFANIAERLAPLKTSLVPRDYLRAFSKEHLTV